MSDSISEDVEKRFQQLADLEQEFEKADVEILRLSTLKQRPLFEKRDPITSGIPNFWARVIEDASGTVGFDEHISPEDAELLMYLTALKVTRPNAEKGDPRDLEITFEFADNDYIPAQKITKLFTFQPSNEPGLTGLVSTPVPITWKEGKDLTGGVNKAAIEAFEERKAKPGSADKGKNSSKLGPKEQALQELLVKKAPGFFAWFSFTGVHHNLGEGDDLSEDEHMDDDGDGDQISGPIEAFPYGDEIAVQFAEEIYPNAVKYFTSSMEETDDEDEEDIDLDSDLEEQVAKNSGHAGCSGKHKHGHSHSHGDSSDEPAKKKAKK